MKLAAILVTVLFTLPMVLGAGIIVQGPADGTSVKEEARFSFSVDQYIQVSECRLIIDNTTAKRLQYNGHVPGSILWPYSLEEGTHQWRIECTTMEGEELRTEDRTISSKVDDTAEVTVEPSGTIRGSYRFLFDFQNSKTQQPAIIEDIAPGDFIEIDFFVPPSRVATEFFFRSTRQSPEQGKYAVLSYKQENFNIYIGKNTTLPIGSSQVFITANSFDGTKATMTVFPYLTGTQESSTEENSTAETSTTDSTTEEEDRPEEQQPSNESSQDEENTPDEETTPPESEEPETDNNEVQEPIEPEPPAPEQNTLQRFLSWLVGIFGS